jgi:hypothetical protein
MSNSKVRFSVIVHDVNLVAYGKAHDAEDFAADAFALEASIAVADALHEKFDNIQISTLPENGDLLFTERPGEMPEDWE